MSGVFLWPMNCQHAGIDTDIDHLRLEMVDVFLGVINHA